MASEKHCITCTCHKQPPDYPVVCPECGISYGPEGDVPNHRPGSEFCRSVKEQTGRSK